MQVVVCVGRCQHWDGVLIKPPFANMKKVELPLITVSINKNQAYAVLHAKAVQILIHLKVVVGLVIDERDQLLHSKTSALQQSTQCLNAQQTLIRLGENSHSYVVGSTRLLACQTSLISSMMASFSDNKESSTLHDIEHMVVSVTRRTSCHIVFLVQCAHCHPFLEDLASHSLQDVDNISVVIAEGDSVASTKLPDIPSHISIHHVKLKGFTKSRGYNLIQAKHESKCEGDIFCFLQDRTRLPSRHLLDAVAKHQGSKHVLGFRTAGSVNYGCLAFPSAVVLDQLWTLPEDEWDIESLLLHKKLEKHMHFIESDLMSSGRQPVTFEECLQQQTEIADMAKFGLLSLNT